MGMTNRERIFFGFGALCVCGFIAVLGLAIYLTNELQAERGNSPRIASVIKDHGQYSRQQRSGSAGGGSRAASPDVAHAPGSLAIPKVTGNVTAVGLDYFTLHITNNTQSALSGIYFEVRFIARGRTVPVLTVARNWNIPGGLEPGESDEWSVGFRPNESDTLVNWIAVKGNEILAPDAEVLFK